ncbi:MAG: hypothetical protein JO199_06430 [Candidatus Eremiobacteraeota bacterium]|nr:hypothetical protein [Candidatus Eremiobacteraeota bacterium]
MRRFAVVLFFIAAAAGLGACGDAGDHFLEFRQNPSNNPTTSPTQGPTTSPTQGPSTSPGGTQTVATMQIAMIATPDPASQGIYPLVISAKNSKGQKIAAGSKLAVPILLSSNATCTTQFQNGYGGAAASQISLSTLAQPFLVYNPVNSSSCAPADVTILATSGSAKAAKFTFPAATPPTSGVVVTKVALSIPSTPNPNSPGTFTLVVSPFTHSGKAIGIGEPVRNPIVLQTNSSCNIQFQLNGTTASSVSLDSNVGSVTVQYKPSTPSCPSSVVTVSAFDIDARPQTASIEVVGSAGSSTVKSLALSMVATPSPSTNGTYALLLKAVDSNGKVIANGQPLAGPIEISSNAACVVGFGTGNGTLTPSLSLNSQLNQIVLAYSPSAATGACPAPSKVTLAAVASGAKSAEFSFNGPTPTPSPSPTPANASVAKIVLSAASTPNPQSGGTFELVLTPIASNGKAIPVGANFASPIQLTTNATCNIAFKSAGGAADSLTLSSAPGSVTVIYTGTQGGCTAPSQVLITAFALTASPQASSLSVLGGGATAKSMTLSMIGASKPDPNSEGVYPLYVTALDSNGKSIPFGQSLTYPIQLSSNASCVVTFGSSPTGNFNITDTIANTSTQVFMLFNPGAASPACPSPAQVIVIGIAHGARAGYFRFTNGQPVP